MPEMRATTEFAIVGGGVDPTPGWVFGHAYFQQVSFMKLALCGAKGTTTYWVMDIM